MLGNASDLIEAYEREEAERIQKQSETESKMLEKVDELEDEEHEDGVQSRKRKRKVRDYSTDGVNKKPAKRIGSMKRPASGEENLAVVPYLKQKPKNKVERKAFEDLEKIRKRRQEVQKKKKMEEEKNTIHSRKQKERLKRQIESRRVELGIQKKNGKEDKNALLKEFRGSTNTGFNVSTTSKFSELGGVGKRFQENFKGVEVNIFEYD